jgi:predicted phosphodiesterase
MPKAAIISDIHGNLEALQAVLRSIESDGVDYIVHLGDLVGYNANPRECVHLLKSKRVISVLGNHDLAVLEPRMAKSFNVLANQAITYTQQQLTNSEVQYLRSMPRIEVLWDKYLLCHGSPESIESYLLNLFQTKRIFNLLRKRFAGIRLCFFGHTHIQKLWVCDQRGKVISPQTLPKTFSMNSEDLYLINPGSVGQPRQKDNRAHYLLFDTNCESVHFKAVPYDVEKAQQKIMQARLPEYLAHRLQDGI